MYSLRKILLTIGVLRQNKNRFGIWFLWLLFHWYQLDLGYYSLHDILCDSFPTDTHKLKVILLRVY